MWKLRVIWIETVKVLLLVVFVLIAMKVSLNNSETMYQPIVEELEEQNKQLHEIIKEQDIIIYSLVEEKQSNK